MSARMYMTIAMDVLYDISTVSLQEASGKSKAGY